MRRGFLCVCARCPLYPTTHKIRPHNNNKHTTNNKKTPKKQANVVPAWNVLKCGMHTLGEAGGGAIVCASAAVVHKGLKGHEAWAAAKGAVEGALEWRCVFQWEGGRCASRGLAMRKYGSSASPRAAA